MAKLPSSFRARNRTTRNFREQYSRLPPDIVEAVRAACVLFDQNPAHPSLRHHALDDRRQASHHPASYSVSPTMQYRAIYTVVDGVNVWYWIGTHAEYKRFTASKR